jgi:DNA-binding transcriptional ArsR family regulator
MVSEVPVDDDAGLVWKALADPTRRAILDLLRDRAHTTGELSGAFPALSRFAVMKHLGVLEDAGLVIVRRRGRERWNHLNGVPLRAVYERWMGQYADRWAESLLRLKETAERQEGAGMTTTLDVEQEVVVAAPREKVFDALCRMGEWWPHAFREGAAVHLEPRVGGRFWEDWGDGDGALYATVTGIRRPEVLTCSGPMGMRTPVTGVFSMELEDRPDGTLVRLSHHAVGPIDDETRAAYEAGWSDVFGALRGHLGLSG